MKNKSSKNQRKTLIVNSQMQYSLIAYSLGLLFMLVFTQIVASLLFLEVVSTYAFPPAPVDQFKLMLVFCLIPLVSSSILGIYYFRRFSNRIAGPIFKINKSLQQALDGGHQEVDIVLLRSDDFFQDVAENVNKVFKKYKITKDS